MAAASEEDGTHDSRPTQDESKDDSKDEAEHLGQMIHKVAMEKVKSVLCFNAFNKICLCIL